MNPLIVDDQNTILAGHGRLEAARLEGMAHVPIVRSGQLSEFQKRAYLLADNKIALNAGWDEELLALELKELISSDEFSVDVTGFSIAEVDQLLDGLAPEEPCDHADDALAELGEVPTRCRLGDIWRIGPHRLICGDALDRKTVAILMEGERRKWSSPIRLTMPRSPAMSAAWARPSIVSLRWPRAR